MKRRSVLATISMFLLGQLPFMRTTRAGAAQQPTRPKPATPSEYEPFKKIAKEKGVKISFNQAASQVALKAPTSLHLDMNMVRASLQNAIDRTKEKQALNQKLRRLLSDGTPVQQVEFVMGSGTYYFPEDLEKAIAQSENATAATAAADGGQCWVCENVCTLVCHCLEKGDQECHDRCRNICHKYC